MGEYINLVTTVIKGGLEKLHEVFKDIQLRFSFVGYRDYKIEIPSQFEFEEMPADFPKKWLDPDDRIELLPFITDYDKFCEFVGSIKAGGGGDTCEDVLGGII